MEITFNGYESDNALFHTVNLRVSVDFAIGKFEPITLGEGFIVTPELDGDDFVWFNVTKHGVQFDDWAAIGGQKDDEVVFILDVNKNLSINLVLVNANR